MSSKFSNILGGSFNLIDGEAIPLLGLGTYALWSQSDVDIAIDAALSSGYRLFDTAHFYANEKELGNSFKKFLPKYSLTRDDIYIITKANIKSANVEKNAIAMVKNSLKYLQTSYVDLLLIHYPKDWSVSDNNKKNPEDRLKMYRVLENFKAKGKVKSLGVSNFEARHIDELWDRVEHKPVVNQCEFHPHLTREDLIEYCKKKGIFFQAHTSLANKSHSLYTNSVLIAISKKHKCLVSQILLAFSHNQNIGVIPKSGNLQRILSNIEMLNVNLNSDEIDKLKALNQNRRYSDCDGWNVF